MHCCSTNLSTLCLNQPKNMLDNCWFPPTKSNVFFALSLTAALAMIGIRSDAVLGALIDMVSDVEGND